MPTIITEYYLKNNNRDGRGGVCTNERGKLQAWRQMIGGRWLTEGGAVHKEVSDKKKIGEGFDEVGGDIERMDEDRPSKTALSPRRRTTITRND